MRFKKNMNIKVLLLGHKGMLGHMVFKYLQTKGIEIETTDLRWPSDGFKETVKNYKGDFIINCIGAIHQRVNFFDINWEIPIFLDLNSTCNIIHPGTDCEMDDDDYGISKKIARDFIVYTSKRTKSIKTSIIGPEIKSNSSLMEWFLSKSDEDFVYGFSKFYWNGNTTLTWAKYCLSLIYEWDKYGRETILSSPCISKKEILDSINEVYKRNINIIEKDEIEKNKCLNGDIFTEHIKEQLLELRDFNKL